MNEIRIYLDMDGTFADLYAVEGWLEMLRAYDSTPYAKAKTMVHMSECNGKLKMIFTTMECLPTKHHLASYSHANMRHPYLSHEELFTRLAKFGVTQHYAICKGDYTDELEQFAKIAGIEYERI